MTDSIDPVQLDPISSGLPEDTKYLGSKMDDLIAKVTDLIEATVRQEVPSPGLFFAMPTHNDFPQSVKTRLTGIIIAVAAATTVTITIGSAAYVTFQFAAADTRYIPLPTSIDGGKDVLVTAGAGGNTLVLAVFLGYPESDRPSR